MQVNECVNEKLSGCYVLANSKMISGLLICEKYVDDLYCNRRNKLLSTCLCLCVYAYICVGVGVGVGVCGWVCVCVCVWL